MNKPPRLAMWSGPRNLSTAMMRAFGNRSDCDVFDEPFYGAYLAATGLDHPMREAVLDAQPQNWRDAAETCTSEPITAGRIGYFKHMTHHMLPGFGRAWMDKMTNIFLIRAPELVVASYASKSEDVSLADIGFVEQVEIFDHVAQRLGHAPPVVDASDIRANPEGMLRAVCGAVGIEFEPEMLNWPAGRRATDGVWGAHWYGLVESSTTFAPPDGSSPQLDAAGAKVADEARSYYAQLKAHALRATLPADLPLTGTDR